MRSITLLLFLCACSTASSSSSSSSSSAQERQERQVQCRSGFLPGQKSRVISPDQINDGYCDCPLDGIDEPDTEACSGALKGGWAGVPGKRHDGLVFTCPQQPSLKLPVSRINDGICDCCDGADEPVKGDCPNICEEVLREERQRRRQLKEAFQKGAATLAKERVEYLQMLQETEKEEQEVSTKLANVDNKLSLLDTQLSQLKREALHQRRAALTAVMESVLMNALLGPLSNKELQLLIVQTCQLAGEQDEENASFFTTCVPLRLAGVDVGIVWETEDQQEATAATRRLEEDDWANLVDRNAAGETVWSMDSANDNHSHRRHRRRLTEDYYDDDHYDYRDEYNDDYYGDDEDFDDVDYDDYPSPSAHRHDEVELERNDELYDEIKSLAFSTSRVSLLKRAAQIIEKIDALLKETDDEEEEGKDDSKQEKETSNVDPMAFQMVRSTLRRREQSIQRGLDYAVSATLLLKEVQENRKELLALAAGTLYHSKIRSQDFYQIVTYMNAEIPSQEESCISPWSILCPPQVADRNGSSYPPAIIVKAAEEMCQGAETDAAAVCGASDEDLPTTITDGYYGYFVAQPRDEQDALSQLFATLDTVGDDRTQIEDLNSKRKEVEDEHKSLTKQRKKLEDQMGGRDHSKYGKQGELYSLRDTCHSVREGKYTYEVCIFGSASQKEGESKSGTSLGRWKGMRVDEETGQRIMEWTKGAGCWNGPERSATVYVTCGAENKVLRAEEPDTCRYVLEMESYIACDDEYKLRHGL